MRFCLRIQRCPVLPAPFGSLPETPFSAPNQFRYDMCRALRYIIKPKVMEKQTYVSPEVEVTEIRIERGFAVSSIDGEIEGFDREEWE